MRKPFGALPPDARRRGPHPASRSTRRASGWSAREIPLQGVHLRQGNRILFGQDHSPIPVFIDMPPFPDLTDGLLGCGVAVICPVDHPGFEHGHLPAVEHHHIPHQSRQVQGY